MGTICARRSRVKLPGRRRAHGSARLAAVAASAPLQSGMAPLSPITTPRPAPPKISASITARWIATPPISRLAPSTSLRSARSASRKIVALSPIALVSPSSSAPVVACVASRPERIVAAIRQPTAAISTPVATATPTYSTAAAENTAPRSSGSVAAAIARTAEAARLLRNTSR